MSSETAIDWPPHDVEVVPWRQTFRSGTKSDRTLSEVEVAIPPMIAETPLKVSGSLVAEAESAMQEIFALDRAHGDVLAPLGLLLLRTESVASSKIERIEAGLDDYARALHGNRSNPSATSMVAATGALTRLLDVVGGEGAVTSASLTDAHRVLMADDPYEAAQAGRFREVQNWIGGSDHSPRSALYAPPPAGRVVGLMTDLVTFSNRSDLPVLVQGAIAHAQFESIHPFTDGNGRIGRALINAVLRVRRTTTGVVVPIASALVVQRDRYFDDLTAYRDGRAGPIVTSMVRAAGIAAHESRRSATELAEIPDRMRDAVGRVRRGSAVAVLLAALPTHPILSADDASDLTGVVDSSLYSAIGRLEAAGVLRSLTDRKRGQVWGATQILDEIEDLSLRIAAAARTAAGLRPRV
ncbi:MAG: Fic family protein [Actinobacteria bacterium]|nr:Fic family protein [Actinomycetota bacterium]